MKPSPPAAKRPRIDDDIGREEEDEEDAAPPVLEAWRHYRSYVDAPDDDDDDGGGEVDELLEVLDLLSPLGLPVFDADPAPGEVSFGAGALVPVLLSAAHLRLASDAVDGGLAGGGLGSEDGGDGGTASSSSPEHHFSRSLHHWPTNPAALSLLANYRRMNAGPVGEVCDLYARAEGCAARWRDAALAFLKEKEEEECNGDGGDGREGEAVDPREWVELLVLNGALDVDYVGGEDEDEEDEEDEEDDDEKDEEGAAATGEDQVEEEEYSSSNVEATASFMSAFLLSTLSRHDEALVRLKKFDLTHRIHPAVWRAAKKGGTSSSADSGPKIPSSAPFSPRIYTKTPSGPGVLPPDLRRRMRDLFAPAAPYWSQSDYDNRGYYSYYVDLDSRPSGPASPRVRDRPTNLIEDVIVSHLLPLAERTLRESSEGKKKEEEGGRKRDRIVGAEWWAHTRPVGANLGHQLHFDTDEGLLGKEGRVTHPVVSSVLYLTGGSGGGGAGPTVVFEQTPDSEETAAGAWISRPRDGAYMTFPGELLHGVLPCAGREGGENETDDADKKPAEEKEEEHRLTFMVGFWTRQVVDATEDERELYSPCGPLPPATDEHSWVVEARMGYDKADGGTIDSGEDDGAAADAEHEPLEYASPAWEEIECDPVFPPLAIPGGLDHRFFVKGAPGCFSASLFDKEDRF